MGRAEGPLITQANVPRSVGAVIVLEGHRESVLVFLPGFMTAASSYRALLEPVAAAGTTVVVPQLYRRGVAVLAGRFPVAREAAVAADLVRSTAALHRTTSVVLGGHSRGGQAAWRAAALLARDGLPAGVVLVDPVDGEGRSSTGPVTTASPAGFACPLLIIGAGIAGRCAPDGVNHRAFAAAAPQARHVVVRALGHADVLQGPARSIGRLLCRGSDHPDVGRATCSALVTTFVAECLEHR